METKREIWKDRRLLPLLWAALILIVSSVPGEEIPQVGFNFADKLAHLLEYLALGIFLIIAFKRKRVLLWGAAFALIDEFHQLLIPGRECSPADLAMNLIGLAVSPVVVGLIGYLKKKRSFSRKESGF